MTNKQDPEETRIISEQERPDGKPPPVIIRPGLVESEERVNEDAPPPDGECMVPPVTIPQVTDAQMSFGSDAHYVRSTSLPEKFKNGGVWEEFLEGLCTGTLDSRVQMWPRPGVDPKDAWRLIVATMNAKGVLVGEKMANGALLCCEYFAALGYMRTDVKTPVFKMLTSKEIDPST